MLNRVSNDVAGAMSRMVSERVKAKVTIRLLHDGTAAAMGFAGLENAARISGPDVPALPWRSHRKQPTFPWRPSRACIG